MTKVICANNKCKWNNERGACAKREIDLDYVYKDEKPQCCSYDYKKECNDK